MREIGVFRLRPLHQCPSTRVFFWAKSDHHLALTGGLSQSGLTAEEQLELLLQPGQDLERAPAGRFPDAPCDYIARAKDLLLSGFLPQFGPLRIFHPRGQCEVVPRSKAWDLLLRELSRNSFSPNWKRPVSEMHDAAIGSSL